MNNKVKFLRGTSDEYAVAEKDSDTIYFTTDDGKLYIGDKEISGSDITIDDTLSDTSTNPVQNKVVKQAIDNKADKTVATTSADGLMSAEDKGKLDSVDDTYALKSKYGDTTINIGRKADTTVGFRSTAEGYNTTASGNYSHAEGAATTASGNRSHAEGYLCTASLDNSHAEGNNTTASGAHSHAEGSTTTASGVGSHSGGTSSTASGDYSFAHGMYVESNNSCEVSLGKFKKSSSDTLFSIGDGNGSNGKHNAFEITTTGGKMHDNDIATTDLIPSTLPANGGSADYATNAGNAEKLGGKDASAYSTSIIKSVTFSAATTNGYIWTGIPFPKYVIGVDLGHFDVFVQFCKGSNEAAARAEWAMMFFSKDDVTTPLNGSFNGVIYYID